MDISESFRQALSMGNLSVLPLALFGGLIAGLNPCCLALYPAAAGACCSARDATLRRSLRNSVAFVLGVATAIAALGIVAAYAGRVASVSAPVKYTIAFVPVVMGLYRLGWVRLPMPVSSAVWPQAGTAFSAGLLLSLVIGPCGTPIIAAVLSFAAYKQDFVYGGILLFAYGVGTSLPILLVGTAGGKVLERLNRARFGKHVDVGVGGFLVLIGLYLLWSV